MEKLAFKAMSSVAESITNFKEGAEMIKKPASLEEILTKILKENEYVGSDQEALDAVIILFVNDQTCIVSDEIKKTIFLFF